MGSTAIALIYSPMGQRSGAHMNPAVTLTYWRLRKIETWDAVFYVVAQFAGATIGMTLMSALLGDYLQHSAVRYVSTTPRAGAAGLAAAWLGEFTIALLLMLVILSMSNRKTTARYTGLAAGCLVAAYIFIEAPLSGMSMNPARTLGSSLAGQIWTGLWIYFTAPPLAMLAASEIHLRRAAGASHVYCAKLNHFNKRRCIFRCQFDELLDDQAQRTNPGTDIDAIKPRPAQAVQAAETLYFG
jgi:aquaporin Z